MNSIRYDYQPDEPIWYWSFGKKTWRDGFVIGPGGYQKTKLDWPELMFRVHRPPADPFFRYPEFLRPRMLEEPPPDFVPGIHKRLVPGEHEVHAIRIVTERIEAIIAAGPAGKWRGKPHYKGLKRLTDKLAWLEAGGLVQIPDHRIRGGKPERAD